MAFFAYEIGEVTSRLVQYGSQLFDVSKAHRNDMPISIEHYAQRVHQFRALMDYAFLRSK